MVSVGGKIKGIDGQTVWASLSVIGMRKEESD